MFCAWDPKMSTLQVDEADQNQLSWTILPIGWWGIPSYQRLATQKSRDRQSGELVLERLRFLDELNPKERYIGRDRFGSDPYWVFIFDYIDLANHGKGTPNSDGKQGQ